MSTLITPLVTLSKIRLINRGRYQDIISEKLKDFLNANSYFEAGSSEKLESSKIFAPIIDLVDHSLNIISPLVPILVFSPQSHL